MPSDRASILPKGAPSRFLQPQAVGLPIEPKTRPLVAHVTLVDLDEDGLAGHRRLRRARATASSGFGSRRAARSPKRRSATESARPRMPRPVDLDRDGDLDSLVASLGVLFPSNAKIGSVVVLENDGRGRFTNRVLASTRSRASPTCAPAISTAMAISTSRSRSSATTMARRAGWRIWETGGSRARVLLNLSGPINVEIVRSRWRRRSRHRVARQPGVGRGLRVRQRRPRPLRAAADLGLDQRRLRVELADGGRSRQGRRHRFPLQQRRRVRLRAAERAAVARRAVAREHAAR